MSVLDAVRFRLTALFQRTRIHDEVEEELRSHVLHRADDLERSGVPRAEAERRARIEFGSAARVREEVGEAAGGSLLDSIGQDVRYAVRVLRKSPVFTGVAIGTLALAIAANAVVFAALDSMILRPLSLPRVESLYSIHRVTDQSAAQSYPNFLEFRRRNRTFEDLGAYTIVQCGLDAGETPTRSWAFAVSANYFDVLGVKPFLGRFFHDADDHGPDSAPYAVLSHLCWERQFQSDPGVVGRVVRVNKRPLTVIGVAPAGFRGTLLFFSPDFFVPMVEEDLLGVKFLEARANRWIFMMLGHVKPGVAPAQAAADLTTISASLEKAYPKDHRHVRLKLARPSLYGDYLGGPMRAFLTALMLLAGLILLAACANLGSLFASRAADRSREVALRLALGAGPSRIVRQLFTEALLIALVGGALGLWASVLLLHALGVWRPFTQFPIYQPVSPDANVYWVALLLSIVSGFLFGAVPVRTALQANPYEVIKAGTIGGFRRRITLRDALLVAQIAICAVLITSSMVAVRGMGRAIHAQFGFEPRGAMVATTSLSMAGYRGEEVPPMQKRMIEAVQSIPGVTAVAAADWVPLTNGNASAGFVYDEQATDLRPGNAKLTAMMFKISPDYFRAAATPLLAGRAFTWQDDAGKPALAIVNPEFARKMFGAADRGMGRRFKRRDGTVVEIVGVASPGKYETLTEEPQPAMFVPLLQSPSSNMSLVVRGGGDPQALAAAIQRKLREVDSGLPIFLQSWNEALDIVYFPARVAMIALGVLGSIAAILSVTGIFGLAAYSISKRMRELGIRMALGAQRRQVLQAALGRAFRILGFGSVAGLVLGLLASRVLGSIVYQATPRDPLVLAGVVLAMMSLGLLATWIPAQRALSIDPLTLLREE